MLIGIDGNEANIKNRVGVNQYAFDLLHALYNSKPPHHFLIYLKNPPLSDLPPVNEYWQYRVIPFPKLWTQTRLPWDLFFHQPRPHVFFSPSHYAPRLAPMPSVISIMDLGFLTSKDQFTAHDYNQLTSWTAYSVNRAKKILAISEFTRQDVITNYKKNPNDIIVTHLAHDSDLFKPTPGPEIPKKYGINRPYFFFLSSLKPSKNIEGLIRAFSQFKKTGGDPNIMLVVAGKKAWLYDEIFALTKELNLTADVLFPGFVDKADVPALMTEASAFVMPSFFEGFGIPVLEAMACGTPVVVSKVASLPEVAGNAGIYIDPTDINSITTGLKTALGPQRQKFITAGLNQVKKFSWADTAAKTLQVLESV